MMEKKEGKIEVRKLNVGSKSDGNYAYLLCNESGNELRLCREGVYPANDNHLTQFANRTVSIEGTVQNGNWLTVSNVTEITEDNKPINSETAE